VEFTKRSDYFEKRRKEQELIRMDDAIAEYLKYAFINSQAVKSVRPQIEKLLSEGKITSYRAAVTLIDNYLKES
jgi:LAO/AO transport system kinase